MRKEVIMKSKFDVLIIGGGPGGLTIGSLLAREGISSAIIEKEPDLGGRYRSVNFHGCRSDNGVRMPTALVRKPEETFMYEFLKHMGIAPAKTKVIDWTMGMVRKDSPDKIEYFSMDPKKGVDNFFDFFAFGSGSRVPDRLKVAKGTASLEEVLLRRRQLATTYDYSFSVGLSFTFGSVFSNVVNPRFGSTGDSGFQVEIQ
jgi:hypothetical protein